MNTIRAEIESRKGKLTDKQFKAASEMALQDLNTNNGGCFTVKEFLDMISRSVEILRDRKVL